MSITRVNGSAIPLDQPDAGALVARPRRRAHASFAHPAEQDLANLLSFYGIEWRYEPTTFPLELDTTGAISTAFTPDFHLPQHGRYLELTTMRQPLVTRKNRKLRLLRAHYPDVDVRVLYRRDVARIDRLFGIGATAGMTLGAELHAATDIALGVQHLVDAMDIPDQAMLVGVGSETRRFASAVHSALRARGRSVDLHHLDATAYAHGGQGSVAFALSPAVALEDRDVVMLTSRVSTGLRAWAAKAWLERHGPRSFTLCALLDHAEARIVDVPVGHAVFADGDVAIAGFGFGGRADLASLDSIHVLEPTSVTAA